MKFSDIASIRKQVIEPSQFNSFSIYLGFEHLDPGALRVNSYGDPGVVTSTKQAFFSGDTIYGKLRPYFRKVTFIDGITGICSTDFWVFQPKPGVDPRFLFYVAASQEFSDTATSSSEGTRMPRASWSVVKDFEVRDIPTSEQRAIAVILGSLDDKIESNRRAIQLAEDLADGVFSLCSDSRMGLSFIGNVTMGSSPLGSTYNELGIGIPFYQGVRDFGTRFPSRRVFTTEPIRFAQANDTLISVRAPVGELNRASELCCIGRGLAALSSTFPSAAYYALRSAKALWEPFQTEGTVFGAINKVDLARASVPWVANESVLIELEDKLAALDQRIASLVRESTCLMQLRDTLLPELLSGRIRVPEAQEAVEAVV